jgi:uracil-DNA glycosylase
MFKFVFVGEKPSKRALQIGATWENGKLAGKTLKDGLLALGIDPDDQIYVNLFNMDGTVNLEEDRIAFAFGAKYPDDNRPPHVVAMGKKVDRELTRRGVVHLSIIHPAARGKIRKTELYQAHLAERLGV